MKKNIGLLIDTLNSGGAQRVVARLSILLNDKFNIYLILFDNSKISYEFSGKILNLNIKPENKKCVLNKLNKFRQRRKKLKEIKKKFELSAVISFLDSPNFVNLLSKTQNCESIISVRNYSKYENNNSFLGYLTKIGIRLLYNNANQIITVSEELKESLIFDFGIKEELISTIYNPYNLKNIQDLSNEAIEPEFFDFMSSGRIVISVGRQTYQKGYWHLIKAFKLVHELDQSIKLVIVGRDEQSGKAIKLIKDLGLENHVLLTGFNCNPYKFIRKSKVYVLTSLYEGFPNALVEAMSCKCAVIAADCKTGPREILIAKPDKNLVCNAYKLGDFGIIVRQLDRIENWDSNIVTESEINLSKVIYKLISNDELISNYSKLSEERAKMFSESVFKERFIEVILNATK